MKYGLIILMILASVQWAGAQDSGQELLLPNMRHALHAGMSLAEVRAAFPHPDQFKIEELSNGTAYCSAIAGYPVLLLLVNDKLTDVNVINMKSKSKFGRWFTKSVNALPKETTVHHQWPGHTPSVKSSEEWITPGMTWKSSPDEKSGKTNYTIEFPTTLTTLPNGMYVRRDSLETALRAEQEEFPWVKFDSPPKPATTAAPAYPPPAEAMEKDGRVLVQILINKEGEVKKWKFSEIQPVGYGFARAVEKIISGWKFEPALVKGEPVSVWVTLPFSFKFKDTEGRTKFWPK